MHNRGLGGIGFHPIQKPLHTRIYVKRRHRTSLELPSKALDLRRSTPRHRACLVQQSVLVHGHMRGI